MMFLFIPEIVKQYLFADINVNADISDISVDVENNEIDVDVIVNENQLDVGVCCE